MIYFRHSAKVAKNTHCINLEISRIGGTIAFCDYLVSENCKIDK